MAQGRACHTRAFEHARVIPKLNSNIYASSSGPRQIVLRAASKYLLDRWQVVFRLLRTHTQPSIDFDTNLGVTMQSALRFRSIASEIAHEKKERVKQSAMLQLGFSSVAMTRVLNAAPFLSLNLVINTTCLFRTAVPEESYFGWRSNRARGAQAESVAEGNVHRTHLRQGLIAYCITTGNA